MLLPGRPPATVGEKRGLNAIVTGMLGGNRMTKDQKKNDIELGVAIVAEVGLEWVRGGRVVWNFNLKPPSLPCGFSFHVQGPRKPHLSGPLGGGGARSLCAH